MPIRRGVATILPMSSRYLIATLAVTIAATAICAGLAPEVGIGKMWFCGEFPKPDDPEYGDTLAHVALNTQYHNRPFGDMVYGDIEKLPPDFHLHYTVDNNGRKLAHQLTMRVTYDLLIGECLPKNWKFKDLDRAKDNAEWKNIFVREMVAKGIGPYETETLAINDLPIKEERDHCAKHGKYIWGIRILVELLDKDSNMDNNVKVHEVSVSVD